MPVFTKTLKYFLLFTWSGQEKGENSGKILFINSPCNYSQNSLLNVKYLEMWNRGCWIVIWMSHWPKISTDIRINAYLNIPQKTCFWIQNGLEILKWSETSSLFISTSFLNENYIFDHFRWKFFPKINKNTE